MTAVVFPNQRSQPRKRLFSIYSAMFAFLLPLFAGLPYAHARSRYVFPFSPCQEKSKLPGCLSKTFPAKVLPYTPKVYPDHGLADHMTEQGKHARGFWITPMYLFGMGPERTAAAMKKGRYDTVVLDFKDDLGQIVYPSKVPLAQAQIHVLISDPKAMVKAFHDQGIYVIARIVSFKDSRLPYSRPDLAVRSGRLAQRIYTSGEHWLDQHSREVQDYLLDLAQEIQTFGVDELQFDYIRFPKGRGTLWAKWMHGGDNPPPRAQVITDFLERVDRAVTIPISSDIFGLTTFVDGDPRNLGQHIEMLAKYVDAISPMMYANGMDTYFRDGHITSHVIELIQCGLQRARQKAPNIVLRPYLQGYSNGVEHIWGPEFVKDQILAAERAGSDGILFWNPTMKNAPAMEAMREVVDNRQKTLAVAKSRWHERITANWCPAKGDVFSSQPADDGKSRRPNLAGKKPATPCKGACAQ